MSSDQEAMDISPPAQPVAMPGSVAHRLAQTSQQHTPGDVGGVAAQVGAVAQQQQAVVPQTGDQTGQHPPTLPTQQQTAGDDAGKKTSAGTQAQPTAQTSSSSAGDEKLKIL